MTFAPVHVVQVFSSTHTSQLTPHPLQVPVAVSPKFPVPQSAKQESDCKK